MRYILYAVAAFLPTISWSATRSVSEGVAASNNTIWIGTSNVRVGISTSTPQYTLDVQGGIRSSGQIISQGSITVQGSGFSVGRSTFVVGNGSVTIQLMDIYGSTLSLRDNTLYLRTNAAVAALYIDSAFVMEQRSNGPTADNSSFAMQNRTVVGEPVGDKGLVLRSPGGYWFEIQGTQTLWALNISTNQNVSIGEPSVGATTIARSTFSPLSKLVVNGNQSIGMNYNDIAAPTDGLIVEGSVGVGQDAPSSKLHVADGDIRITTTTGSRGIIFQDGSTQSTAYVASNIQISTNLAATRLNSIVNGQCHTSTISITFSGSPAYLQIKTMGSVYTTGGGAGAGVAFLMDGTYVSPQTSGSNGVNFCGIDIPATGTANANCVYEFQPSAGAHNFCLTFRSDTLALILGGNPANAPNSLFVWRLGEI